MKGKSLGWLLLVGALAVPAVLFYKWWTQMKATQGVEAKQALPSSAPFAGGATPAPAAEPPAAPAGDAPAPPPSAEPVPGAEPSPAPQPEPAPQAVAQAAPDLPPAPAPDAAPPAADPSAPPPAAEEPAPAANPGGMVAKIEYMPQTTRDPMLSVADMRELLKQKMAAQISQQEVQKAAEEVPAAPPPPPARPLCDGFDLQGIIGAGGDVAAIVNDRIVREGDHIAGAVVERLTTRTVVFRKGKKTCMKRVSK